MLSGWELSQERLAHVAVGAGPDGWTNMNRAGGWTPPESQEGRELLRPERSQGRFPRTRPQGSELTERDVNPKGQKPQEAGSSFPHREPCQSPTIPSGTRAQLACLTPSKLWGMGAVGWVGAPRGNVCLPAVVGAGSPLKAPKKAGVLLQLPLSLAFTRGLLGIQSISSCCLGSEGISSECSKGPNVCKNKNQMAE